MSTPEGGASPYVTGLPKPPAHPASSPPPGQPPAVSSPKNLREDGLQGAGQGDNFFFAQHQQQQQQQQAYLNGEDYAYGEEWEDYEDGMPLGGDDMEDSSRASISSVRSQERMVNLLPEKNPSYGFKTREASLSCRYLRQRHKVVGDKWKTIGMGGSRESHPDLTQHHRRPSDGSLGDDSVSSLGSNGGRPPYHPPHHKTASNSTSNNGSSSQNGHGFHGPDSGRPPISPPPMAMGSANGTSSSSSSSNGNGGGAHSHTVVQAYPPKAKKPRVPSSQQQQQLERAKSTSPKKKGRVVSSKKKGYHYEDDTLPAWASHALGALVHDVQRHCQALMGKFVKAVDDTILGVTAPAMGLFLTFAHDLPRASNHVLFEKDLRMPMPRRKGEDTRHSLSFLFMQPSNSGRGRKYPTILVRNPYGRLTFFYFFYLFAQRGYNVVVQDVRGRGESTGVFDCIHDEEDSQATLEWITSQPWYSADHGIGLLGMSYNGFVLYETFKDTGKPCHPSVKAVVPINTTSRLSTMSYRDGPLHLELIIRWSGYLWTLTRDTTSLLALLLSLSHGLTFLGYFGIFDNPRLTRALRHLPVHEITKKVTGVQLNRFQMFLSPPGCDFVKARDASTALRADLPPAQIHASWYDIFLIDSFFDFQTLVAKGNKEARIMISSDYHIKRYFHYGALVREALVHFKRFLRRDPVPFKDDERITVQIIYPAKGLEWVGFASWPPAAAAVRPFLLSADGQVAAVGAVADEAGQVKGGVRAYTYYPSDPTPSVGGNGIGFLDAGERVQNQLETSRGDKDLLVYTSEVLAEDMYVIGVPQAELYVRCLSPRAQEADFVVRLCDVSPAGVSRNICDGVKRLSFAAVEKVDEHGTFKVVVDVYPTAVRLAKGHRLRVHVASAGFIRWERNVMAYGYPSFIPVRFEVVHGKVGGTTAASALHLPLVPASSLVPSLHRSS